MVQEELQEFELSRGEHSVLPLVTHHMTIRIKPQAVELPDPLVPQVQPGVVPSHLGLDEGDVLAGGALRDRMQSGQLALDPFKEAELETNEIVVDAHPMARVFPVLRFDVLSLQRPRHWVLCASCPHGHDYTEAVADLLTLVGVSRDHEPRKRSTEQTRHRRRDQGWRRLAGYGRGGGSRHRLSRTGAVLEEYLHRDPGHGGSSP